VAGMREGSLALWDLRESAALHRTLGKPFSPFHFSTSKNTFLLSLLL
jgi:hypothetical protein